jgi:mannosyl-oligosaccharide glucosidase
MKQKYAQTPGPNQKLATELYSELRLNLIKTVYDEWVETGFAWEQYNPETGKGQRTQHFTGWTSLVVKIMGMPDLSGGKWKVGSGGGGIEEQIKAGKDEL